LQQRIIALNIEPLTRPKLLKILDLLDNPERFWYISGLGECIDELPDDG
jgi:hypothetical protein